MTVQLQAGYLIRQNRSRCPFVSHRLGADERQKVSNSADSVELNGTDMLHYNMILQNIIEYNEIILLNILLWTVYMVTYT